MRILQIAPYYAPAYPFGGVVAALEGLSTALAVRGHKITILTTDALDFNHRNPIVEEALQGVRVIRVRNLSHRLRARLNLSSPFAFGRALRRLYAEFQPQVIHTHELRTVENLFLGNAPCPVILSPHGTLTYEAGRAGVKRAWDRLLGARLARRIAHIAALTEVEASESRDLWAQWDVPFPGVDIIPNGVSSTLPDQIRQVKSRTDLRARLGLGNGVIVLFVGRLHERKGLGLLIPAFARAAENFPDARLLIVGPDAGFRPAAEALVRAEGIESKVIFTGMLTGDDRLAALATGDIFALPAVGEGLSMAALEAMAAHLPLIVTPGCNLPQIEKRGAGLLVKRAVPPLAQALERLIADLDQREAMGAKAFEWMREQFTWEAVAESVEILYQSILTAS